MLLFEDFEDLQAPMCLNGSQPSHGSWNATQTTTSTWAVDHHIHATPHSGSVGSKHIRCRFAHLVLAHPSDIIMLVRKLQDLLAPRFLDVQGWKCSYPGFQSRGRHLRAHKVLNNLRLPGLIRPTLSAKYHAPSLTDL